MTDQSPQTNDAKPDEDEVLEPDEVAFDAAETARMQNISGEVIEEGE